MNNRHIRVPARRLRFPLLAGVLAIASVLPLLAQVPEAPSTVDARYRAASATTMLVPGEKIADLYALNVTGPYVLQRLTERSYWFQAGFYSTVFYVGDAGVLLFDPLDGHARTLLQAVASVTDLPVAGIVYSHNHADHIGGTPEFLALLDERGQARPEIIATRETAAKMMRIGSSLPSPTRIVDWPEGAFTFEGLRVEAHGFAHAAHTDDHSAWLLADERVLHAPDLLNPDQPPFWSFAGSERFLYLEDNLRAADALAWDHFSGGHGNIGAHADFAFHLKFIADLKAAVAEAMNVVEFGAGIDMDATNAHTGLLPAYYAALARHATDALRPVYGQVYGFEQATPANAQMVAEYLSSYR